MEISYWQSRWEKQKTGFHMDEVYPLLIEHWAAVEIAPGVPVFIPFCGKSLDMHWVMQQGHPVVGVDVSELAIRSFLDRFDWLRDAQVSHKGHFTVYRVNQSEFWVGDLLKLHPNWIPQVGAVYDKAAIVALRPDQRTDYVAQLRNLVPAHAPYLLQSFDYPQHEMPGPPFSVPQDELETHYGDAYSLRLLAHRDRLEDLAKFKRRGLKTRLHELLWLLTPKQSQG